MRMVHYYLALAFVLVPCLALTIWSGALHDGTDRHLVLGLFTAFACLATNTLLILFMIVTGRVLKAAMQTRALPGAFLAELNQFFAQRRAYPLAVSAAFAATVAAVLGYGRYIGVAPLVHVLAGVAAVLFNVQAIVLGVRTLRANQRLLDRAAAELDRLDASGAPHVDAGGPQWTVGPAKRWLVFAASAWGPYLYWALVVWRGAFGHVSPLLLALSALVSLFGLAQAWRQRASPG
jgi:cytochrome b subunit of formate dehydrogenase